MLSPSNESGDVKNHDEHGSTYDSCEFDYCFEGDISSFDITVGHIEDILVDSRFQQLQREFVDKYWYLFEDDEENKLIYTTIFGEYVSTMENYIERYLKSVIPGFDMEEFLDQIRERKNSLDGEVFEMLLGLSDFTIFKEMMLDFKAVKEGKTADSSEDLIVTAINLED